MPSKEQPFRARPLVFIDIETTGLSLLRHEIIELACLIVDQNEFAIQKEYESKIAPVHIDTADREALELNGYSAKDWNGAPPLRGVLAEFSKIAQGGIPVGHVVHADLMFLQKAYEGLDLPYPLDYHYLDTVSLAYAKLKDDPAFDMSLAKLLARFGIKRDQAHRAMNDIRATYELFKRLIG